MKKIQSGGVLPPGALGTSFVVLSYRQGSPGFATKHCRLDPIDKTVLKINTPRPDELMALDIPVHPHDSSSKMRQLLKTFSSRPPATTNHDLKTHFFVKVVPQCLGMCKLFSPKVQAFLTISCGNSLALS